MDLDLAGKAALVIGGSQGIGRACALQLSSEGVRVAIAARDLDRARRTADEIGTTTGVPVLAYRTDTADDDLVASMTSDVVAALGCIDILVNCAAQPGGQRPQNTIFDTEIDDIRGDLDVKVLGYFRTARSVAAYMIRQGSGGRIVNVSGLAARQTGSLSGSVRNIAVVALTKNLADELAPYGIGVVCVHPGATQTERTPAASASKAAAAGDRADDADEAERAARQSNLLGRMLTAAEVADVVAFLASPRSVAINGDAIAVGGGVPGAIYA